MHGNGLKFRVRAAITERRGVRTRWALFGGDAEQRRGGGGARPSFAAPASRAPCRGPAWARRHIAVAFIVEAQQPHGGGRGSASPPVPAAYRGVRSGPSAGAQKPSTYGNMFPVLAMARWQRGGAHQLAPEPLAVVSSGLAAPGGVVQRERIEFERGQRRRACWPDGVAAPRQRCQGGCVLTRPPRRRGPWPT